MLCGQMIFCNLSKLIAVISSSLKSALNIRLVAALPKTISVWNNAIDHVHNIQCAVHFSPTSAWLNNVSIFRFPKFHAHCNDRANFNDIICSGFNVLFLCCPFLCALGPPHSCHSLSKHVASKLQMQMVYCMHFNLLKFYNLVFLLTSNTSQLYRVKLACVPWFSPQGPLPSMSWA